MKCESVQELLGAFLDGELDANTEFQLRDHLADCAGCTEAYDRLRSLKQAIAESDLSYAAPPELQLRIRKSLHAERNVRTAIASRSRNWLAVAAAVLLAVSVGLGFYVVRGRTSNSELLARQVVSSHVRAMLGSHLVDVPSSDQHTVKPWFNGKLDFSPPVKDLKAAGFPLVGGRIDYVDGRPVAALVYQRRQHIINLFIWPVNDQSFASARPEIMNGYNLIRWTQAGMTFWAVSDLNGNELQQFVALFKS